jgi:hypothetical protein
MRRTKTHQALRLLASLAPFAVAGACGGGAEPSPDGDAGGHGGGETAPLGRRLEGHVASTRFSTSEHMLASMEMQLSGEPFAQLLGRALGGYDRFGKQTDVYVDPKTGVAAPDPLGFSLAVESYEYSKQEMNMLSFESGAGLSLMFGPRLNPSAARGEGAYAALRDRLQYLALASRAAGARVGKDFVAIPPPDDPQNAYGWPGFWPVFAEFRSFDPAILPAVGADHQCSLAGAIDEPLPPGTATTYVADYECDATSLNLPDREAQVEKVLEPEALGWAAWKQALWVINYWGALHDVDQHPILEVPAASLSQVGVPGNKVIGKWKSPLDPETLVFGKDGTFFGNVSLEGWQGLVMLEEIDNKSSLLLGALTTTDGKALSGARSVRDALDYDYTSPLRWWPAAVAVTEEATAPSAAEAKKYFPAPAALAIEEGESRLRDLTGLIGGFAEVYAMTDQGNPEIGGSSAFRATFDGAPFAGDNQLPDGEDSLHDRALAILKVALVDLDRLHFDAARRVLVDTASPAARGNTVSAFETAYSIVALRTAYRALASSLTLYSNDTPDPLGVPLPLDRTSLKGKPYAGSLGARLVDLVRAQADFLADRLVGADGVAAESYDLAKGARDPAPPSLAAQAAAIRGLLEAYLATSDTRYRVRAAEAFAALQERFWMEDVRAYQTTLGERAKMAWTPRAFGALSGALRQAYKLLASRPGQEAEAAQLLSRFERTMKLVANGWDDRNRDGKIDPGECLEGRLQMAERALTGELSIAADHGDRDHDCVPDIASARLPAALAGELVIERR